MLKSLVSSVGSDRLKKNKKSSPERASQAARNLYVALTGLQEASKDFVASLTAIAEGRDAQGTLQFALMRTGQALVHVTKAVNEINPQLSIHAPEIAQSIEDGSHTRNMWMSYAEEALALQDYTSQEQGTAAFREVAQGAQQTLVEIEAATESLRRFLAEQFTFKENF